MKKVVLGLGSNQSFNGIESIFLLSKAVSLLSDFMEEILVSSVYRTKPMYVENQNCFYNMVLIGNVLDELEPEQLLLKIHTIEDLLGRNHSKEIRFGPRTLDIDIEYFDDKKINTHTLTIPHPRIKERAFVLKPLLEILHKNTDVLKREEIIKIESWLKKLSEEDAVLFMDSKDFLLLKAGEVQNGDTNSNTGK